MKYTFTAIEVLNPGVELSSDAAARDVALALARATGRSVLIENDSLLVDTIDPTPKVGRPRGSGKKDAATDGAKPEG